MKKFRAIQVGANLYNLFADEFKSAPYRKNYSDDSFWKKLKHFSKFAGMKVVYPALMLHYMLKSDEVPLRAKLMITASLGYFILPIDFIPDFAALIGFTDDLGVLVLIIKQMATYITPEIRTNARAHVNKWFREADLQALDTLEKSFMH